MPRNKTINTEWLLDNVKYEHRFGQFIATSVYRTRPDRTLRQYIRQIIHISWSVITFCSRGAKIKSYLGSFQLFKSANVALTG